MDFAGQVRAVVRRGLCRARRLCVRFRADEGGQVLLLSGFMVFAATVMAVFTLNATKGIYNRIVAQNAVDAAADAAAVWQARGCNVLQHLNNLHYNANVGFYVAESVALAACGISIIAVPAEKVACAGPWAVVACVPAMAAAEIACSGCYFLPWIDKAQEIFASAILKAQEILSGVFPVLAFAYANEAAHYSGADNLLEVVSGYLQDVLAQCGLSLGSVGDLADGIASFLGQVIHVYAAPIVPQSILLHVDPKEGDGLPWKYAIPPEVIEAGYDVAKVLCRTAYWPNLFTLGGDPPTPDEWGWKDKYYWGNPGFMTWVAGRKGPETGDLLGLGDLVWLNARKGTEAEIRSGSSAMWQGSIRGHSASSGPFRVPTFAAVASSQVEGEPVIAHGEADAKGCLIPVHFQKSVDDDATPGTKFLIWH